MEILKYTGTLNNKYFDILKLIKMNITSNNE